MSRFSLLTTQLAIAHGRIAILRAFVETAKSNDAFVVPSQYDSYLEFCVSYAVFCNASFDVFEVLIDAATLFEQLFPTSPVDTRRQTADQLVRLLRMERWDVLDALYERACESWLNGVRAFVRAVTTLTSDETTTPLATALARHGDRLPDWLLCHALYAPTTIVPLAVSDEDYSLIDSGVVSNTPLMLFEGVERGNATYLLFALNVEPVWTQLRCSDDTDETWLRDAIYTTTSATQRTVFDLATQTKNFKLLESLANYVDADVPRCETLIEHWARELAQNATPQSHHAYLRSLLAGLNALKSSNRLTNTLLYKLRQICNQNSFATQINTALLGVLMRFGAFQFNDSDTLRSTIMFGGWYESLSVMQTLWASWSTNVVRCTPTMLMESVEHSHFEKQFASFVRERVTNQSTQFPRFRHVLSETYKKLTVRDQGRLQLWATSNGMKNLWRVPAARKRSRKTVAQNGTKKSQKVN